MTVETLRQAIADRAASKRIGALVAAGISHHSRRKGEWRNCPCSWCEKKREATRVIGNQMPKIWSGRYVEDMRDAWRDDKRQKYRKALKELEIA